MLSSAASPGADPSEYVHAAWISKRHAITSLPSVDSLKSLRNAAKASVAKHPFLGFGQPCLQSLWPALDPERTGA